ncbi:MAG TPA: metalloregulator ArsR/SmtB family transcription factor [Anaerolineales bacterium]|nr:metalloregulator ArsR/SmtB family transcription factor [Anaerolineales bacterium]
MIDKTNAQLLVFFSALSDATRLKIVGLLAQDDFSVEELAEMLALRPPTVSHHLSKLGKIGLVSARAESYYNVYHLNTDVLSKWAGMILNEDKLPGLAGDVDIDAYDKKVIADYTREDGSLKTIPSRRKKLEAVLRYVAREFVPGADYPEAEVNRILHGFHEDTATLRRELVAAGLMVREKSVYRLAAEPAPKHVRSGLTRRTRP